MVAPRILWRYILRDVALHMLLGLALFTVVLVATNLLRFLEGLLAVDVGAGALLKVVGLILPSYLAYAIPTALLFGVLITFGRMSGDGEVIAIRSAGISVPRLLPPVLLVGALCAGISGYLQFEVEPNSRQEMKGFMRELQNTVRLIRPGEFRRVGERTVYVEALGDPDTCPYRGVLIGDLSEAPRPVYIAASCAELRGQGADLELQLANGSVHLSASDSDRYRRIQFKTMRFRLDPEWRVAKARDVTFAKLLEARALHERGETTSVRGTLESINTQIQRRMAFPLSSVVLAMLAVPLGIRPLRSGRSAGAITAIGVMAFYWMFFTAAELAAESGAPPGILWLPNLFVMGIAVFLIRATIRGDT